MRLPTTDEIRALHQRHAPSPELFDSVYTHCEIVAKIADQLAETTGTAADRDLVRAGCLLHDIGVYRLYDASGRRSDESYLLHGLLGHEILRGAGFPEELCRFCSCHTGVGLTRQDIVVQQLPLPEGDYVAVTTEEQLVMYADKFHSKTSPPRFVNADSYAEHVRRFGEDKVEDFARLRAKFGEPELDGLARSYGHAVQEGRNSLAPAERARYRAPGDDR
ncbi:HD domain-containing protein [Actinacidiphila acidipaludis]|uniref:HD domain-containing protein n=1 Tax=Actinacidiphila acidipaludis TaxID=2873382 RepID=A0ABS7QG10_9ACTN|nr:HD domain-containing protein [Streptomyces acidipaludis]MBY8882101.1 HD domain-containing protein [Streptomyces acidipaludis]